MVSLPRTTPWAPDAAPAPPAIRVAVVEDDFVCRNALAHALQGAADMHLQWVAASRAEALAALQADDAPLDVLLLDLGLPDGSGLDVLAVLRARWPGAAAMVSTIFGDEAHVLGAIEAGAMGYLLKDLPPSAVVDEVRSLHAGGSPINPMVARKLLLRRAQSPVTAKPSAGLEPGLAAAEITEVAPSAREAELLRMVARGYTLDEVARAMGVSRHTVRTFVRRVYAKLQVTTQAEAVSAAARKGWIDVA
ncbi:response regulator transcription factor [Acidovorax sp. sif1233]|uniref:helix-turn-helix transcriptional regulator n=1 Tax=unclassified Acidovorax TaxID=2684926 RepID=UPI001C460262|nr:MULTISPECIES: response regulator transcription factor [unclassified Acidovorax]MBV7430777.1 response regulator transcription factor [Acidovorax sp. sif0732]MBV7451883.1 response regulator transcription factor [Acidovorax sp. sif0715]MBV7457231.1 response regulator transcription factor [Acidovorax sp. sif1233]